MAVLPIVLYPDERLEKKAAEVAEITEEMKKLARDMAETMYKAPGVGLAAPQVGKLVRLVVIDVSEKKDSLYVMFNPVITKKSAELLVGEEGCLSLPGIYEDVKRSACVSVEYTDAEGRRQSLDAEGLLAICVQHELDHLDGVVFIDHLSRLKKMRDTAKMKKKKAELKKEKEA